MAVITSRNAEAVKVLNGPPPSASPVNEAKLSPECWYMLSTHRAHASVKNIMEIRTV